MAVESRFPFSVSNSVNNLGIITYRWHQVGVGSVTDGTTSAGSTITGAGSTILTISGLTNDVNQAEYFLQADYVPEVISGVTSVSLGERLQEMHRMNH